MPTGDFDCPECGQPGTHYVPPSLGEPGFYYCQWSTPAVAKRERERRREAAKSPPWRPPVDTIEAAKREALQELALDVFAPSPAEPRDPLERWGDVEVES